MKSWKWEMCDHGNWITNAVRFATKAEAEAYGFDLGMRWMGMPDPARAAESEDEVNYKWLADKGLVPIEKVAS